MKIKNSKPLLFFLFNLVVFISNAQVLPETRLSPVAMAAFKKDGTYIKITYGQPYKKERYIFGSDGGLVPYGKVWRMGANEATELTVTRRILFAGDTLEAGTYSMFSIPGPEQWEIILNSEIGMWGHFKYDPLKDVLKKSLPKEDPKTNYEALVFRFEEFKGELELLFVWDRTLIRIPIVIL